MEAFKKICLFPTGPSEPPQSVRAVNRTISSIGIKWDEVPGDGQDGLITSYTVSYHSDTSTKQQKVVSNVSTRFANLTQLTKNTKYTITVLASNDKGNGPASDPIVVATSDGSKYEFGYIINYVGEDIFICSFIRNDHLEKESPDKINLRDDAVTLVNLL